MNFNQYECGGGKAVPVNPNKKWTPQFDQNADHPWFKIVNRPWQQFESWLSTQPTIHCDPSLDGVYPVGEFGEIKSQWRVNKDCPWRDEIDDDTKRDSELIGLETRLFIEYTGAKQKEMEPEWIPITEDNLPPEMLICEWLHPEYWVIKGNLVRHHPTFRNGDNEVTEWIYPNPDPVSQADICLSEFTHYRKSPKKPATPKQKGVEQGETQQEQYETVDRLKQIAISLRMCTRPIKGHTDPESIVDCWNELDYVVDSLFSKSDVKRMLFRVAELSAMLYKHGEAIPQLHINYEQVIANKGKVVDLPKDH